MLHKSEMSQIAQSTIKLNNSSLQQSRNPYCDESLKEVQCVLKFSKMVFDLVREVLDVKSELRDIERFGR